MRKLKICILGMVVCILAAFGPQVANADDESTASVEHASEIKSSTVASDDAKALELMEAICSDGVNQNTSDDFDGLVLECNSCPEGASADDGRLRFQKGYIGDFSGDGTKEAILATTGCGQGFNFRHSTVMADRSSGKWKKAEYRDGIHTKDCTLIDTSTSHRLLCKSIDVGQGIVQTQVTLRGVHGRALSSDDLLELFDRQGACRFEGPFSKEVSEKTIKDINDDGQTEIAFILRTKSGTVAGGSPPADPCERENYDIDEEESLRVWSVDTDGVSRNSDLEDSGLPSEKEDHTSPQEEKDQSSQRETQGRCFTGSDHTDDDEVNIDLCSTNPFGRGF